MEERKMNVVKEAEIIESIKSMQSLIYNDKSVEIFNTTSGKDIVIFMGNTRCGKSTIVNHFIGTQLKATKIRRNTFNVVKVLSDSPGPTIGEGSVSETTVPTSWTSSRIQELIVDSPGFDDNRGAAQDIANAFYIREILANANSVKFVLISDINDIIHTNINQFIDFIDKIYTMLPESRNIFEGMTLVLTKDIDDTTTAEIAGILQNEILYQKDLVVKNRDFIIFLAKNVNHMGIVKMPESEGTIDDTWVFNDIISIVEQQSRRVPNTVLSKINPGISDKSRVFLLQARNAFTECHEFDEVLKDAQINVDNILNNFDATDDSQMNAQIKQDLIGLEQKVKSLNGSTTDILELLKKLHELLPGVKGLQEESDTYTKLKFMRFVDQILDAEESGIMMSKLCLIISYMSDRVGQCRINLQEKMMEISAEEARVKHQEIMDNNAKTTDEMMKRIEEMKKRTEQNIENQKKKLGIKEFFGSVIKTIATFLPLLSGLKSAR